MEWSLAFSYSVLLYGWYNPWSGEYSLMAHSIFSPTPDIISCYCFRLTSLLHAHQEPNQLLISATFLSVNLFTHTTMLELVFGHDWVFISHLSPISLPTQETIGIDNFLSKAPVTYTVLQCMVKSSSHIYGGKMDNVLSEIFLANLKAYSSQNCTPPLTWPIHRVTKQAVDVKIYLPSTWTVLHDRDDARDAWRQGVTLNFDLFLLFKPLNYLLFKPLNYLLFKPLNYLLFKPHLLW